MTKTAAVTTTQPAVVHPAWCDGDRCTTDKYGDVVHRSTVQSVPFEGDCGGGRFEFWLFRGDERLGDGGMVIGAVDVDGQVVSSNARPVSFCFGRQALALLGGIAADLMRRAPEMSTYETSDVTVYPADGWGDGIVIYTGGGPDQ